MGLRTVYVFLYIYILMKRCYGHGVLWNLKYHTIQYWHNSVFMRMSIEKPTSTINVLNLVKPYLHTYIFRLCMFWYGSNSRTGISTWLRTRLGPDDYDFDANQTTFGRPHIYLKYHES